VFKPATARPSGKVDRGHGMRFRKTAIFIISISTCLAFSPALANDDLVRGIFGIIAAGVGQGIQNQQTQQRQRQFEEEQQQFTVENEAAERRALRAEIQRRLNLLGFNAGYPDGSFGRQTRQAIADFQGKMGHRATGKISEAEIAVLYQNTTDRSQNSQIAASPDAQPRLAGATSNAPAQAFVESDLPQASRQQPKGAAAYTEPGLPQVSAAAYQEPGSNATSVPANEANAQAAQKWVEPEMPTTTAAQSAAPSSTQTVASSAGALYDTIREAVCSEDNNKFASVKSFIDAGVIEKEVVIEKVDSAIRRCANTGGTARGYLLQLAGNDITIPTWISSPAYNHATKNDAWFGSFWLPHNGNNRILVNATYSQMLMMIDGPRNYFQTEAKFAEQIRTNPNKRDCLGLPPLFYAAVDSNFDYLKWLLDLGANPNIAVPYMLDGVGVIGEGVDGTASIADSRTKGYGLLPQYGCVDNGPSAALMNAYKGHNELIPVWALALERVNSGANGFPVATAMLAKVPSVPASTIVDIMDDNRWRIRINEDQDLALIKLLVSMGADINGTRRDGTKPMAAFVQQGIKKQNLEQLLAIGARI